MNARNPAIKRIKADVKELAVHPSSRYHAHPLEDNMFEWHFTIRGPPDTAFEGGIYHGRILLPAEYPMKPPNIVFLTKNGRFDVGTKICLSISAYHEESWQPAWGVRTMLEAIISFLPSEGAGAIGALDWTADERRKLAKESLQYKCPTCGLVKDLLSDPQQIDTESNNSKSDSTTNAAGVADGVANETTAASSSVAVAESSVIDKTAAITAPANATTASTDTATATSATATADISNKNSVDDNNNNSSSTNSNNNSELQMSPMKQRTAFTRSVSVADPEFAAQVAQLHLTAPQRSSSPYIQGHRANTFLHTFSSSYNCADGSLMDASLGCGNTNDSEVIAETVTALGDPAETEGLMQQDLLPDMDGTVDDLEFNIDATDNVDNMELIEEEGEERTTVGSTKLMNTTIPATQTAATTSEVAATTEAVDDSHNITLAALSSVTIAASATDTNTSSVNNAVDGTSMSNTGDHQKADNEDVTAQEKATATTAATASSKQAAVAASTSPAAAATTTTVAAAVAVLQEKLTAATSEDNRKRVSTSSSSRRNATTSTAAAAAALRRLAADGSQSDEFDSSEATKHYDAIMRSTLAAAAASATSSADAATEQKIKRRRHSRGSSSSSSNNNSDSHGISSSISSSTNRVRGEVASHRHSRAATVTGAPTAIAAAHTSATAVQQRNTEGNIATAAATNAATAAATTTAAAIAVDAQAARVARVAQHALEADAEMQRQEQRQRRQFLQQQLAVGGRDVVDEMLSGVLSVLALMILGLFLKIILRNLHFFQ